MTTPQHKDTTLDGYSKVLTTTDGGKEEVWVLFEDARANRDKAVAEELRAVPLDFENSALDDAEIYVSERLAQLSANPEGLTGTVVAATESEDVFLPISRSSYGALPLKETPNED